MLASSTLIACAQSGGQTGDITMPTLCEQVRDTVLASEMPDGFAVSPADIVGADATLVSDETLTWVSDREASTLRVNWSIAAGAEVQVLGVVNCPAQVRAPVTLSVSTSDGLLDESLSASAVLMPDGSGYILAEQPVASLSGLLSPYEELGLSSSGEGELVWRMSRMSSETEGTLHLKSSSEDEMEIASW